MIDSKMLEAAIAKKLKTEVKDRSEALADEYVSDLIHAQMIEATEALEDDKDVNALVLKAVSDAAEKALKDALKNIKVAISIDSWVEG